VFVTQIENRIEKGRFRRPPTLWITRVRPRLKTEEDEILESTALEVLVETCSREFVDMEQLESNLTRASNLWARTQLDEQGMLGKAREARDINEATHQSERHQR